MGHLLKTCPQTQLIYIALQWPKKTNSWKSGPQNWPGEGGKHC